MTNRRQGSTGRPSKGDRHAFSTRIPRVYAERVIAYADAIDRSYSDVLADLVIRHADELDPALVQLGENRLDVEANVKGA